MSNNYRDERRHKGKRRQWDTEDPVEVFAPLAYREPERQASRPTRGRSARRVEVECIIRQNEPNLPGILIWDGETYEQSRGLTGKREKWVRLPRSQIQILDRSNGNDVVAMPEWLAADRGLKVRGEAGES